MKKVFFIIIAFVFIFFTNGCNKDKPAILFNKNEITPQSIMDYSSEFYPNQRIYYIVLIPKKIYTREIEIQIIKKDNSYEQFGYKLFWTYSARLKDNQIYYYNDYVVIPETGAYLMRIYSKDKPTKILCEAQFFVRN